MESNPEVRDDLGILSCFNGCSQIPWIPELLELFEDFKAIAPGNTFDVLGCVSDNIHNMNGCLLTSWLSSPGFYLSFWQMSNYDLYFPKSRYEETDKALHSASEALYQKFKSADRSADRGIRKMAQHHKSQRQRYLDAITELSKEKQTQELVCKFTNDEGGRFDREKMHWFAHGQHLQTFLPCGLTLFSSLLLLWPTLNYLVLSIS